jgi:RNA polymerase sigma-70 factor, ECF subfamily
LRMPWENLDDAALLRAGVRDREAFGAFYRMHAVTVYRWFVVRVERDVGTASELTAETFAEALRSLPRFRGHAAGDGTAWLFGIARNLAREHHRSRRVRDAARRQLGMPLGSYVEYDDAEERLDVGLLRGELEVALAHLPDAQREAIWLRVVKELDYPEIAAVTNSSEQAVRLRVFRGLRAMRLRLTPTTSKEEC